MSFNEIDKKSESIKSSLKLNHKNDYIIQKSKVSIERKIKKLENKIDKLEKSIKAIDIELEINYEKTIETENFFENYNYKKKQLKDFMDQWEAEQNKLNSI